jgi:HEAT repeat protein
VDDLLSVSQIDYQAEIHEMVSSKKVGDRKRAADALGSAFVLLPDKTHGWQDLHRLAQDLDSYVQWVADEALSPAFALLPDKIQGWQDLHRLTQDHNSGVRRAAAYALGPVFALLPDKTQGEQDLFRLTQDPDSCVRWDAAHALDSAFALLPDKTQGWQDLLRLIRDQDRSVQWAAARALGSAFALLPDKTQGWQDLLRLTQDQNSEVRWDAVYALSSAFVLLPDKTQGWQDLHGLTQDQNSEVRRGAARALSSAFILLPEKTQGWQDLLRLTQDQNSEVRWDAVYALSSAFVLLPDKTQGWQDLHGLTQDQNSEVRRGAARALSSAFILLPDKIQGWQDLLRLTQDQNSEVRWDAVYALGSAFVLLPDKIQGWQDLLRLTQDQNSEVRRGAVLALGSAFALMPDKTQSWEDLLRLTQDKDSDVRMYAYHSLGRFSVYKALEANEKNNIKSGLEAAVEFFEKSSQEQSYSNPARFCLPFYRSYLALTFQGASEAEVQKYLAEVKEAVGSSENKRELFGAVKNLAKALEETQKLKEKSIEHIQSDLEAYQWYCDRAAEHMAAAEEKAPGAVKLMKKCNPIIEERIKSTIAGIQKTARELCLATRGSGTKYEAPGAQINREAKSLSSEDPLKTFKSSTRIASILKEFCGLLPRDKRGHACEIVDEIEAEQELFGKLSKIELALTYLQPNIDLAAHESATNSKLEEIHIDIRTMDKKLNTIIFDMSKIKIGSGNIITNLWAVRTELNKIAEMEKGSALNSKSISKYPAPPNENQIELGKLIETKVIELEEILLTKTTKEDNQAILNKLEGLKPSTGFEWLGRIADLISVFDASIKVFQILM